MKEYIPLLIFSFLVTGIAFILLCLSWLRGKRNSYSEKESPYECGFSPFDSSENQNKPFDIHFYIVAMLFIIFDIEVAFMIPWAFSIKAIGVLGFYTMVVFLAILIIGFIYELRKGALEWP
jgi:NADH-quinone oxidoreductase subunit A